MNSSKEQISTKMLMFSVACFIQSTASFTGFTASVLKQDTWMCVISGYLVSLPIIYIYLKLSELYPKKSLIEINDCVLGPILGKIFSILYIWFFFSLVFLNANNAGAFVVNYVLPETPVISVLIMIIFVSIWAVRKGIETMTRYSALFAVVIVFFIAINTLLLLDRMQKYNFLPMFSFPARKYIQATHIMTILPFSEVICFMMLFPYVDHPTSLRKPVYAGLSFGALTVLAVIVRDTAVLGGLNSYLALPTFEAIRLISVEQMVIKSEVLFIFVLIILVYFKVTVLLYATVKSISQLFRLKSYKVLVTVVAALSIGFASNAFPSAADQAYWGSNIAAYYSGFFEVILPAVTLFVAVIRKSVKGNQEAKAT